MGTIFKNKNSQIRSGWKIAITMMGFYGFATIISIPISILVGIYSFMSGQTDINSIMIVLSDTSNIIGFITMFLQEIAMITVPIFAWKFFEKKNLEDMGFGHIKFHFKELIIGLLFGAISMTIVFVSIILIGGGELSYSLLQPKFSFAIIANLLLFILVGFGEEILGRGYIMSVLKQTKNIYAIMIISSIIFSLMHSLNPNITLIGYINIFLVGALFAYMYIKSGNIWMPIGYHITWNYFQGNVFGFQVSGLNTESIYKTNVISQNILNGGFFGPEGGLIVTTVIVLGFVFVKWYHKKNPFIFLIKEDIE